MNEALYQSLSKKAAHQMPKDRLNPYDYKLYMEILAELIVKECIEIADKGWADPGHQIKQHFGVEE